MTSSSTHNIGDSPPTGALVLGRDLSAWHERMGTLMDKNIRLIALKGAGKINGIEPAASVKASHWIAGYISRITRDGTPVVLMYDGDADNRSMPDIGAVFGQAADSLRSNGLVLPVAAQTSSRLQAQTKGDVLRSRYRTPYETYSFPDDVQGGHASLTQSQALAEYVGYEQIFVGPAGFTSLGQLSDLNNKARRPFWVDRLPVRIIQTLGNPKAGRRLAQQFAKADTADKRDTIAAKIEQRTTYPHGVFFNALGELALDKSKFHRLELIVEQL